MLKKKSFLEAFGPSAYLEKPEQFSLSPNSTTPMTRRGTAIKLAILIFLSMGTMLIFWSLLVKYTNNNFIEHGLGWFILVTPVPLFYMSFIRKWKNIKYFTYVAIATSIMWGVFIGSFLGSFEEKFDGIGSQSLLILIGILSATMFTFRFTRFKGKGEYLESTLIFLGALAGFILSVDAFLSFTILKYSPMAFTKGGAGPALWLIVYMLGMAILSIPLEIHIFKNCLEKKYGKEAEWYFAYRMIALVYMSLLWVFMLVLFSRGKSK